MKIEELVNQYYDNLSPNDRETINLILKNKEQTKQLSSTQLAAFCHISRTTLLRMIKKLSLQSFTEFKYLLLNEDSASASDGLEWKEIIENYHNVIEELKKMDYGPVCGLLYQARNIYLYGTGNEQKSIAEEIKRIFLNFGKCCMDLFDYGECMFASRNFGEDDVFIIISLSGETREGIDVLKLVQQTSVKTLSITRWNNNTIARMCGYNLYAGTKMLNGMETQPYEVVSAFYILLDILSVNYLEYIGGRV
ncbi:SIS domain-containing protein [Clostridium sp. MCC353]|uniref:MurR/RpiR family transcriptional regulator n=1 Tax=Clostridium sp. MCC353 TaxID=2592646 RepID=UPI001C01C051|nr:MurR/RpiR family transcriptional regulator [Clostridium sp. MCC353]MBT9776432.1 SIS domain-containing protein [Clostridium sp. MCC353]